MTVKQLISELSQLDQDAAIKIIHRRSFGACFITGIESISTEDTGDGQGTEEYVLNTYYK